MELLERGLLFILVIFGIPKFWRSENFRLLPPYVTEVGRTFWDCSQVCGPGCFPLVFPGAGWTGDLNVDAQYSLDKGTTSVLCNSFQPLWFEVSAVRGSEPRHSYSSLDLLCLVPQYQRTFCFHSWLSRIFPTSYPLTFFVKTYSKACTSQTYLLICKATLSEFRKPLIVNKIRLSNLLYHSEHSKI